VPVGSAETSAASAPGVAVAAKNRLKLYVGLAALMLALAAGGYLVFATKSGPMPLQDPKVDGRAEAAKAPAERQRAEAEAARQKAEAAGRDQQPLKLDLSASKIELVDGRYVLAGEIFNSGPAPASTTRLKLVFRKGEEVLGERTYSMIEGPIAPGGRLRFSLTLDDPPAGVTQLAGTVE
jgi:hypothetical protein